jgi:phospholipid/cholesterol/gamma-HCH transport system permease protein
MLLLEYTLSNFKILFSSKWYKKNIIINQIFKQILFTGIDAIFLITLSAVLVGFIIVAQSLVFLPQYGASEYISNIMVFVIREIGPIILMFILIGRSGNAISVEIANMKLNNEIYYLENTLNIDTKLFLLFPRVLGFVVSIFCLSVIFNVVTIIIGYFSAIIFVYFPFFVFVEKLLHSLTLSDIIVWILKVNIFGLIIAVVSYYQGITVAKTIRDVPRVTTRCFIQSMIICLIFDIIITVFAVLL